MPVFEHDGSSSDEYSTPLGGTPIPEELPDHDAEFHDGAPVTSTGVESLAQENAAIDPVEENIVINARGYQIEMFEKSLIQNIIVAVCPKPPTICDLDIYLTHAADGHRKWQNTSVGHLSSNPHWNYNYSILSVHVIRDSLCVT